MTAASAKISVAETTARSWRENLGAGARFVAIDENVLIRAEVDSSGTMAPLSGACSGQSAAAAKAGNSTDPARLEQILGASPGWIRRDGTLFYDPDVAPLCSGACSSSELQLLARDTILSAFAWTSDRTLDEVLRPRFFAIIADASERHSHIGGTSGASSLRRFMSGSWLTSSSAVGS